jgi:hypothetical protein
MNGWQENPEPPRARTIVFYLALGELTEELMTYNPNDPYRANLADDEIRRQARPNRFDDELQADPELAEGPASGGKIAMFAIAVAVVLGAVFYGLNNTSVNQAGTSETTTTAQTQPASPAAPPGMRDVTPRANTEPGMTTGAAPARPAGPTGQDTNKTASPPADAPAK